MIEDFSYEAVAYQFSRRATFSDAGLLESLSIGWDPSHGVEIDTLRCGAVVVEAIDLPNPNQDDAVSVYYYGCDDFALPTPLPEL